MPTSIDEPIVGAPPPSDAVSPLVAPPTRHRRWPLVAAGVVLVAATVLARAWPLIFAPPAPPVVAASGRIEGREVTLAAKAIQGRVKRLLADEGQMVNKGQLLAELDVEQLEAQAASANASVATLDAQVGQAALDVLLAEKNSAATIAAADAAVSTAQAQVLRANAVLTNATIAQQRAVAMFNVGAISQQEVDQAEMVLRTSEADLAAANKEVARADANLALARASADTIGLKQQQVHALEASRRAAAGRLAEAQANLAERLIVAPTTATIVSRPVEVGDVVSAGTPIFQLVDMSRLYLKVYIPEPDIAKLHLGDPAEITVDAFPDRRFTARVSRIYEQAEFTPKNVETAEERLKLVFGVELALVNPDSMLKPGMPADCVIHWTGSVPDRTGHGS